jgi:hypothetical protein
MLVPCLLCTCACTHAAHTHAHMRTHAHTQTYYHDTLHTHAHAHCVRVSPVTISLCLYLRFLSFADVPSCHRSSSSSSVRPFLQLAWLNQKHGASYHITTGCFTFISTLSLVWYDCAVSTLHHSSRLYSLSSLLFSSLLCSPLLYFLFYSALPFTLLLLSSLLTHVLVSGGTGPGHPVGFQGFPLCFWQGHCNSRTSSQAADKADLGKLADEIKARI